MVPFVGQSYQLSNRKADVQRTVNMYLKRVESGTGKATYILDSVPGLAYFAGAVGDGQVRGMVCIQGGRAFFVSGVTLYELFEDTSYSSRISMVSATGLVSMVIGRQHIVIADGSSRLYIMTLATNADDSITDVSYTGSVWIDYLGGRYVFGKAGTDQFGWTDIDDPTTIDPLDFATAESSPDGLVKGKVFREELWLFGAQRTEVWRPSSSPDAAFEKNQGVSINIGCAAANTVCVIDNSIFWIGQDENGGAVVYSSSGYAPRRVSTRVVEEQMQSSTDISSASAKCLQYRGDVFVSFQVPGVSTTWCYNAASDSWHEEAEFVDGEFEPSRGVLHMFAFGRHLIGDEEDLIYRLDADLNRNHNDILCRERTSPHSATASLGRVFYSRLRLDCETGTVVDSSTPEVELYYSNDGGHTWSDSMPRSLGVVGQHRKSVQWNRLGSAEDRVWRIRCTDDVKFSIVNVDVQSTPGRS